MKRLVLLMKVFLQSPNQELLKETSVGNWDKPLQLLVIAD